MEELKWPEITEDTPLEEVKKIHQQIWDYVIEHGEKPLSLPYYARCAACEWIHIHQSTCEHCPIIWPVDGLCSVTPFIKNKDNDYLFSRWAKATIIEEKTELARQIRDLPWKFEMEENENV